MNRAPSNTFGAAVAQVGVFDMLKVMFPGALLQHTCSTIRSLMNLQLVNSCSDHAGLG